MEEKIQGGAITQVTITTADGRKKKITEKNMDAAILGHLLPLAISYGIF